MRIGAKKVSYKGVKANKPDNVSMKMFKRVIDELGKDYCFSVDDVLKFISTHLIK